MKLKSLLFGSAAVIAAGTGVQAADLPTVEPVEYVRICDVFGTGFYYIPGTETCLKVGGYVRAESHYVSDPDYFDDDDDAYFNNYTTRARGQINLDARTQTDFGLVRAYIALEMTVGPSDDDTNYSSSSPNVSAAFIQISNDWGTYTAGHTGSFFDFWGADGFGTRIQIDDPTTEQTLFGWTFAAGNGFSFTIAAEDPASSGRRMVGEDTDWGGQESPDGVVNVRVDQGWGSAQIMGAVRRIHDGSDDDGFGYAVGAGVSIGIPGGWALNAQGGYSEGAIGYITNDPGGIGDFNDGDADDPNEAWTIRAGISGPVANNITAWVNGSYTHVEEADGWDEYDFWGVVVGARWSPVSGLYMGPEFAYNNLDYDGFNDDLVADGDVWGVMWRVQRSF
jgi:opacity protein-like surface antigen